MNTNQAAQARQLAAEMIAAGAEQEALVHVLYLPTSNPWADDEIQGLSTPLSAGSDLSGLTSRYYTLAELAGEKALGLWPIVRKSTTMGYPVNTKEEAISLLKKAFNASPYGKTLWETSLHSIEKELLAAVGGVEEVFRDRRG